MKNSRMEKIMEAQQKIHFEKQEAYVGQTMDVIVDTACGENQNEYIGRTQYDAYEVDAVVHFASKDKLLTGDICKVKITEAKGYDLKGVIT